MIGDLKKNGISKLDSEINKDAQIKLALIISLEKAGSWTFCAKRLPLVM